MLDFTALAEAQKENYLHDLMDLIKIKSVHDDALVSEEYPVSPGPTQALLAFLEMAEQDGFRVKNIDNVVGYAEIGEGEETLAILAHLDVMPAGNGWDTDPFDPVIKDGNIYGRGASDDKGPGLAAYYALKALKDQGVEFKQRIRFIVGTDEERDWYGMQRYFEVEPAPTYGFSPDAEFPVINGEKGMVSLAINGQGDQAGSLQLVSFKAGLRFNMVPREATAVLTGVDVSELTQALTKFTATNPVTGEVKETGDTITVELIGKAAHGAEPELGINAGTYLAKFLQPLAFTGHARQFIDFVADKLHLDTRVHNFAADFTDEVMGDMTMNAGIIEFDQATVTNIDMNFRFPKGITVDEITAGIADDAAEYDLTATPGEFKNPHYVDPSDPIVEVLMDAYRHQTGDETAQPMVVGGGTYGRLMERGVAFGALMPGTPNVMHQANEYQPVNQLIQAIAIYMEAIYTLAAK